MGKADLSSKSGRAIGVIVAAALLSFFSAATAPELKGQSQKTLTPPEIARAAFPSVVLLVMEDKNGTPRTLGSGFFIGNGIVATNMHVIEGAAQGYAKLVGQKNEYQIDGILGKDSIHDLVLLAIKDAKTPAMTLDKGRDASVGEEVYVVGNPLGLEGTFSQGIVSGIRQIGSDTVLQITAPISPGSSGGPVLNAQGAVIGVAVATFREGQNLNFAVPASYLESLISGVGSSVVPLFTNSKRESPKSIIGAAGSQSTEGVVGGQFTWDAVDLALDQAAFSFSLRNQLMKPVKGVTYVVIFIGRDGKPIDAVQETSYSNRGMNVLGEEKSWAHIIRPGLAVRESGTVTMSVKRLTTKVDIRILGFEFSDGTEIETH